MEVLRVRIDEDILVARGRHVVFRLSASPADDGQVRLYLARPYLDAPLDSLDGFKMPVGEVCEFEFEGSDHIADPSGTVEVTVAAIEGGFVDMYVKLPGEWGASVVTKGDA